MIVLVAVIEKGGDVAAIIIRGVVSYYLILEKNKKNFHLPLFT